METKISNEEKNGNLQQGAFEPLHCQKDYLTDTVTVQFRGDFDKEKAIEYMLRCYASFDGMEVIEISPNDFYMGLENIGYAVFQ